MESGPSGYRIKGPKSGVLCSFRRVITALRKGGLGGWKSPTIKWKTTPDKLGPSWGGGKKKDGRDEMLNGSFPRDYDGQANTKRKPRGCLLCGVVYKDQKNYKQQ